MLDSIQCITMEEQNKLNFSQNINEQSLSEGELIFNDSNEAIAKDETMNTTLLDENGDFSLDMKKFFRKELLKYTKSFSRPYWRKFIRTLRKEIKTRFGYRTCQEKISDLIVICPLTTLFLAKEFSEKFVSKIKAESGQEDSLVQQENTTFTDQRETTSDDGYITSQIEPSLQQASMPESEWHVRNIMAKPIPFWSGDWSVSDTLGKELKSWDIPGAALFGPHYNLVSTFTFFRGHPEIRFQVNGTKFHSGRLIAAFVPVYDSTHESVLYPVSNLTSLPHVILDASIANSGVISLPFVHMNSYFNTAAGPRGWQSLGRLFLMVFNKLRASDSASQSVGVTAWISYSNCELHQPCFAHKPSLPGAPTRSTIKAESSIEGLIKNVAPRIVDMVAPELGSVTNFVGDVLGGAANQDKPTDPVEISRWTPNIVTGLSQGEGLDKSSRLCLRAGTYTVPDADLISTTQDDMNLLELCKIPTRFELFDWKNSQGTGTRLTHFPICPNLFTGYAVNTKVKPNVEVISPTMLAYISRYFKFWRGSLRYKIQIIASQMHTGRLMISFGAGINLPNSQQFGSSSYLNTYTIDLQEKHEVEFTVPFLCERLWLRSDRFRKFDETGMEENDQYNWENLGYIDIYVLNRLSLPDSVSSSVAVNLFISAGDDFELSFPSELDAFQGIGNVIEPPSRKRGVKAESLIVTEKNVTTRTDIGPITLGKGNGYIKSAGKTTMGENAMDLKTLLRRYTKVYVNNGINVGDNANYISFKNTPCLSGVNKCFGSNGIQYRTALCHFSELFSFWRGSLRYKLVYQLSTQQADDSTPVQHNISLKVIHVPGVYGKGNFTPQVLSNDERAVFGSFESQGVLVGGTNVQGSLEFEVPFYTPYTQLKCMTGDTPNSRTSTGTIFITMETPNKTKGVFMSLELYQAAGDDFSLNYLRAAPRVQFVNAYDTTRDMSDNAPFIHASIPPICSGASSQEKNDDRVVAESLGDYIPGVKQAKESMENINKAAIRVDSVCDTANHILLQASKKLGISSGNKDDDEEEPSTTLLDDASSLMNPLYTSIEVILNYIKQLPSTVSDYLKPNLELSEVIIEVSNLVSGISSFSNTNSFIVKCCSIVTIVSTLLKGCITQFKNSLYHFVTGVLSKINDTNQGNQVSKAESNQFDLVAPITATLSVALGIMAFKKLPSDKETTDLCRGISEKLRMFNFSALAITNIRTLWKGLKELMQWCTDYVMSIMAPHLLAILKLEREFDEVDRWAAFIDSLDNIQYCDKIHYDYEFRNKLFRCIDKAKHYNSLLIQGKCGSAGSVVREYVRKALEIGNKCELSKNELPFRKDPFCIFMYGGTDIGKSGSITGLGFDIMDSLEYPRHNRWCAINCTEKFFSENYRQQSAVYFDDFSTFTSEEQYQKFFNLKANTAYPLDMAFRKGEYFNSDFIFGTTNTPYPKPNFVTNHDALLRRRNLLIEADWADDDEIQEAIRNRQNMARYRKLDNSHLRFRFRDPKNEQAQPGAWMTYQELVDECVLEAREHLTRQQEKLNHDLLRAGYILPTAESGEKRGFSHSALIQSDLNVFDFAVFDALTYKNGLFDLTVSDEYYQEQWKECEDYCQTNGINLQAELLRCSYELKEKPTLITRIRGKLSSVKEWLKDQVTKICDKFPWIKELGKWTIYFVGAIMATGAIWFGSKTLAHKCICFTIRHYGFRCGFCGKWPSQRNILPRFRDFMMSEWAKLYGSLPYKDNHITTLEEEAALMSVQKRVRCKITEPFIATKNHAESVYSDITKGQKMMKVTANSDPYSINVKGQSPLKLTAESENINALIQNRIFPYMYPLRTRGNEEVSSQKIVGYAIGDRYVLCMKHFFYNVKEGEIFDVYHNGAWLPVEFLKDQCINFENKDLIVYKMPKQFHSHKRNVQHFISEDQLAYFQNGKGALCKIDSFYNNILVENLNIKALKELKYEFDTRGKSVPMYVQKAWQYSKCSSFGDCGSVLVAYSDRLEGKILGIHIASGGNYSYSQLITREMLESIVDQDVGTPIPKAQAKLGNLIPPGHLGRIGKVEKGKGFYQSSKTEIIPTEIHGMVSKPVTFPSVLSPNDERLRHRVNPLQLGIEKYSHVADPFPKRHREIVNIDMREEVKTLIRVRTPKPLTMDEAVLGIQDLEGYERLPKSTSPGYPWILTRPNGAHGKTYLFDEESGLPLFDLQNAITYREEKAKKLQRIESVWIDCKKDERRSLEKIQKGSTRIFAIPPVDFSILMRKYTLDFCVAVKNSRADHECKVGIDAQSLEWTTLYYWLSEFSPYCIAGDFSRFDGSMPAEIIDDVRGDISCFYSNFGDWSDEDDHVLEILFDELIHCVHLAQDEFYMTHIGNKSGNPITVILNSRVNSRYIRLAWLGLAEEKGFLEYFSMAKFHQYCRQANFGDDNIVMIKEEVLEWFNQETISEYLARFGITYTNEEKTGITKFKSLNDCTFLKQSFNDHESLSMIKVPHMKQETILELLNWTRIAPDQDQLLYDNCNDALRFAYFMGEKYFNDLRNKIISALLEKEKNYMPQTYMDFHLWFLSVINTAKKNSK